MKAWKAAAYSYAFLVFANIADILSSIGKPESNPLMQTDVFFDITFSLKKALIVKSLALAYYLILGLWTYVIVSPVNRTLAFLIVSIIPMQISYQLTLVAFQNLL